MPLYQPSTVPNNPADLKRFLDDELFRIAKSINGSVKSGFGGMVSEGVQDVPLTAAPIPLSVFDEFVPQRRGGVAPDVTDSTLTALDAGHYHASFVATLSNIGQGVIVFIEFTVNGGQARTIKVDPSNQTAATSVAFSSLVRLERGDVLQCLAYLNSGSHNITFEDVSMFLARVSGRDE